MVWEERKFHPFPNIFFQLFFNLILAQILTECVFQIVRTDWLLWQAFRSGTVRLCVGAIWYLPYPMETNIKSLAVTWGLIRESWMADGSVLLLWWLNQIKGRCRILGVNPLLTGNYHGCEFVGGRDFVRVLCEKGGVGWLGGGSTWWPLENWTPLN